MMMAVAVQLVRRKLVITAKNTLLLPPFQWRLLSLIYNNNPPPNSTIPSQSFLFLSTARSPDENKDKKKKKKDINGSSRGSSSIMSSEEWNKAWESSWLPEDHFVNSQTKAPWETSTDVDLHFPSPSSSSHQFPHHQHQHQHHHNQQKQQQQQQEEEEDLEARAFVEEMNEHWSERRRGLLSLSKKMGSSSSSSVPSAGAGASSAIEEDNKEKLKVKKQGYLGRKQVVHAGLWAKEIEKEVEEKLGVKASADDIDRLLDTCSQIFEQRNNETDDCESRGTVELKNRPDGWESTSKPQDGGSIWNLSQREEDILVQEYDRRIAYTKFRINSFIKSHIFSRRRPIDGWKYMIEELGPNSRKRKNEVQKMTGLADTSMEEPFKEERIVSRGHISFQKRR